MQPRQKHKSGLNLTGVQSRATPSGIKNQILIIPSTNTPSFGSMFICDIRGKGIILNNLTLQFNVSPISGLTGTVTSYPHFNPAFYFFQRIEICQNGQVLDTIYGGQQFLLQQWLNEDQDRIYISNAAGN